MECTQVFLAIIAIEAMAIAGLVSSDHMCYSRTILNPHSSLYTRQDCADLLHQTDQKVPINESVNTTEQLDCNGWNSWGGSFYRLIDSKQSWNESYSKCQEEYSEGHLLYIEDEDENNFVWLLTSECTSLQYRWIGLNDYEKEGEWKWGIKDVEYFNWGYYNGKPEPSEGQSWSSHNEDCGLIGSETGEWFDFQCPSKAYAAVCEREADNS